MEAGTQVKLLTASGFLGEVMVSWRLIDCLCGNVTVTENGQEWRHSMVKFSLDVLS